MTTLDVNASGSSGPIDRDTVDDCVDDNVDDNTNVARFPGLRVEAQLGVGGSGVVYRAWDAANGRHVALKVLRAERWGSETQRSRFRREVEILRRLADPGVVGILADGTTTDGAPWFTMELIADASLQDRIDRAALPPLATCVAWIRDVARTLARLHAQGVVHRDVKPSNILLQDGSRARLADFGVVLLSDEERLTVGPRAVGTPRFMAPEQMSGSVADWRLVDVYALGLVLAELLGPGRSSQDLAYVVRRATAATPADRYPGAATLADELDRWLSGHSVRLRASALIWRARQSPWMIGLPQIAAVTAGLVLVVLAVVSMRASQRDAQAAADWAIARTGLAEVWATGDVQAADDWVARFAFDPARLRTPAAGRAWLELAALHRDAARDEDELDALGRALASTDNPDVQAAAIAEVVAVYRRLRRWPALGHLLAALPAEGIELGDPLRRAARADLALAEGDVAAAIASTPDEAPLLAPLQALRAAPPAVIGALDSDDDGVLEWVVGEPAARDPVREQGEHGAPVWRFGPLAGAKFRDAGGRGLLHTTTGLWSLDQGGAARIGPQSKHAARVGPRVFGVPETDQGRRLVELAAGALSTAHAATAELDSFVQGVASGDVDGDGAPELVAALGPPYGFLVRAYRVLLTTVSLRHAGDAEILDGYGDLKQALRDHKRPQDQYRAIRIFVQDTIDEITADEQARPQKAVPARSATSAERAALERDLAAADEMLKDGPPATPPGRAPGLFWRVGDRWFGDTALRPRRPGRAVFSTSWRSLCRRTRAGYAIDWPSSAAAAGVDMEAMASMWPSVANAVRRSPWALNESWCSCGRLASVDTANRV